MAQPAPSQPIDILRKSAILVLLVVAMWLLHRFAVPGGTFDPRGLMALGFIILAAFTVGELVEVIGLPHITGYLMVGMLLGHSVASILAGTSIALPPPFDHGVLTIGIVEQLGLLDALALALIALTAGGELKLDALKKGLRSILGILGGQVLLTSLAVGGIVWLFSGQLPGLALPALANLGSTTAVLALGGVIASISLATSPAATIAVINGNRAEGPMTQQVLSVVVLKDVIVVIAFSAATVLATGALGVSAETGFLDSVGHIVSSMLVGVALGGVMHLYLHYINMERLLFLVGVIYTTTFVVNSFHGEPALTFIIAGIVVANYSPHGERLIHEVERLAMPVYVVFFTLAGAKLHLDVLSSMASFAVILVSVRIAAIWLGTWLGARWTDAGTATERYGWMGFVSQAGLAITLADAVRKTYPDGIGDELFSLMLGAIAINEMVGPVLFQAGIKLAGENAPPPGQDDDSTGQPATPGEKSAPGDDNPWGPRRPIGHADVDATVAILEDATRAQVKSIENGPLVAHGQELAMYVRSLKREYLRFHRDLQKGLAKGATQAEKHSLVRAHIGGLGDRWCDLALDRVSITEKAGRWSPKDLVEPLDRLSVGLPLYVRTSFPQEALSSREEGRVARIQRTVRRTLYSLGLRQRTIPFRDLVRFHLSGMTPARLEGVAAVVIRSDLHLAGQTMRVFEELVDLYQIPIDEEQSPELDFESLKNQADTLFQELNDDAERTLPEVLIRTRQVFAQAVQDIESDCWSICTPDLGGRERRYSRVFRTRTAALKTLDEGMIKAWKTVSYRYGALALSLELKGIEGEMSTVVNAEATRLAKQVRERGPEPLERILNELSAAIEGIEGQLVAPATTGGMTLAILQEQFSPLSTKMNDVERGLRALAQDLASETHIAPLTGELHRLAMTLTEWHNAPDETIDEGEWKLPNPAGKTEVPLRSMVLGLMENPVRKRLLMANSVLEQKVGELLSKLDDLQRVLVFNLELAQGESDSNEVLSAAQREVIREMMVGAVGRSHSRLKDSLEEALALPEETHSQIYSAVMGEFESLHHAVQEGSTLSTGRGSLGQRWSIARWWYSKDGRWKKPIHEWRQGGNELLRVWLGESRLAALREEWGLHDPDEHTSWELIHPRKPLPELPSLYTLLFSHMAFDTGELPPTRQKELDRLTAALDRPQGLKTAAIISEDAVSCESLVGALTRRADTQKVRRWSLTSLVDAPEIDRWFNEAPKDHLTVVEGLEWMFRLEVGGFATLTHLVQRLVEEQGRGGWLFVTSPLVWSSATTVGRLGSAITTSIELEALESEELGETLLARHHMSGFRLEVPPGTPWQNAMARLDARPGALEAAHLQNWTQRLHAISGGNLTTALALWLSAIAEVNSATHTLRMGPIHPYPLHLLSRLPEHDWLVLMTTLRQGWTDVSLTSQALSVPEAMASGHLARLEASGVLTARDGSSWSVPADLSGVLMQCLATRRWS